MEKRISVLFITAVLLLCTALCAAQDAPVTGLPKIDMTAWQYEAEDNVYYQLGISYCETPADPDYENLAIIIPAAYLKCSENGGGTWTCSVDPAGKAGEFTAKTAPVVIPVETPGYSAMAPLSEYSSRAAYTDEGFIYLHAGCRGRDQGAPAGVTDLKAAIRYFRYTADLLPGDPDAVFTFGMSGGGAQSALLGATGDSSLYEPYLQAIGAVSGVSDAILGAMCWCPITNLDLANEAYEWMMGVTRSGLTDEEQAVSDNLAAAFATHLNEAGLRDPDGNILTLEATGNDGIYQGGSYYDYMITIIERSLNHFLRDTTFPYDASASSRGGRGGGMRPDGDNPGGSRRDGELNFEDLDDITRSGSASGISLSGVYETPQDYIDALNANGEWVIYDARFNLAEITGIADFVRAVKPASKNIGAFDQLDGGQGENTLFGYGDGKGAHFDPILARILSALGSQYAEAYAEDMTRTDALGNTVDVRLSMYSPLYFLLESEAGFETASVAKYWRIRSGLFQGDCALSTEMDLALALQNYETVAGVDFETIWGAGHTKAERSGESDANFIQWVKIIASGR